MFRSILSPQRLVLVAGTVAWVLASGAANATQSNRELEDRAAAIESRLMAVERANEQLVQMQQQLDAATQELRKLHGEIDEARHELEQLRQQQRDLYSDVDRRMLLIENGGVGVAAAGSAAAGSAAPPSETELRTADEASVYSDAFAALKAQRYDAAVKGFNLYLAKYPQGPRADNATYWLGESHYVSKDFDSALKAFQAVGQQFPDSRKAPDALLKVGYCQYELKAFKNARGTLNKVVADYPGTDAARLAEQRLTNMDVDGR
jgi:tol-pal system protein YbgF